MKSEFDARPQADILPFTPRRDEAPAAPPSRPAAPLEREAVPGPAPFGRDQGRRWWPEPDFDALPLSVDAERHARRA